MEGSLSSEKIFDAAQYVAAVAPTLGLTIAPVHLPGVLENMTRIEAVAGLFLDFPMPEEEEPAFVFVPSAP
jgi:hypothetical protein